MAEFWQRLKQRKLVQWAVAYVAFAFALLLGVDIVAQQFGWPGSVQRGITLALVVGFFVVLVLAWYHGERGAQRVGGTELVIIALLLAVGGGMLAMFAHAPDAAVAADGTSLAAAASVDPRPAASIPASPPMAAAESAVVPAHVLEGIPESAPEKSVAVLPFANEGGDKDEQYFSDGLSEDLITALTGFEGLKVISRNSAFQFRDSAESSAEIGRQLGVAHLLEGSVRRGGDDVRITATLVKAADGRTLWSERYDRPYKDLFSLQDAIVGAVAGKLKAKLLDPDAAGQNDRPPSGNLAAYTAYQHGRAYEEIRSEVGSRQAIDAYSEAVRLDPKYATAYTRLSAAWISMSASYASGSEATEALNRARAALTTAARLEPDSPQVLLTQALVTSVIDMRWQAAEAAYRRALQAAPNSSRAKYGLAGALATLGQVRTAAALTRDAMASDPRRSHYYYQLSWYLAALGQPDAARQAIRTAMSLSPGANSYNQHLAMIEVLRGDSAAAMAAARREAASGGWREIGLAIATQAGDDRTAADAALDRLIATQADVAAYQVAEVYALRRDPDNTFKWLDRAWANRDPGLSQLLHDPLLLRYRDDPRFAAFARKVGLPATTDAIAMQ